MSAEVIAETSNGQVRGAAFAGIARFLGIPYAAAPIGPNRFRAPAAPPSWDGVRDALGYGPTPPKTVDQEPWRTLLRDPVVEGEECLNLNVWTPDPGGSGLPVMVWIHGGSFRNGSSTVTKYDGSTFARDGVVCVTLNYRLGVEGFADIPGVPANRGLLDQIAALEWVQSNIAHFGGDPHKVTIFGESAGAMSVTTLLSLDLAKDRGLFHRAIAQSGAGHVAQSRQDAAVMLGHLAERLGVEPTLAGLESVGPEEILPHINDLVGELMLDPDPARWGETTVASNMPFMPVIDGDLLKQRPIDAIAAAPARTCRCSPAPTPRNIGCSWSPSPSPTCCSMRKLSRSSSAIMASTRTSATSIELPGKDL